MSTENTTNVEVEDFTFPDGRKRRRSPELQTWFLTDNRPSHDSPTVDERGQQESSLHQTGTTLASVLAAARSKRRKATDESTSRRAVFRFPRLASCETEQPQWFRDAVHASIKRPQLRTPPSSPSYLDEPIHRWDPTLLERYSNKRSTKKETLVNTVYRSKEEDPAAPSDAERLFAELEKRFYSDEPPRQEQERDKQQGHKKEQEQLEEEEEVFYDAKEYFSDEEESSESDSDGSASALLDRQDSTSSSLFSEFSFSTPLRRSQRTRKTKRDSCVGCEDCTRPTKRKNSSNEKHDGLAL